MPLQDLSYFTPGAGFPTIEQSDPWIGAVNSINEIRKAQLANQSSATANQFQPALLQNEQLRGQLANQNQATTNQYQPNILQNQVLEGQLTNQKSQAEQPYWAPQAAANVAHTQAETPYLQVQTKADQFNLDHPLLRLGGVAGNLGAEDYLKKTGDVAGAMQLDAYNKAQIAAQNAEANYKNSGGSSYGKGVDANQLIGLHNQIRLEHPDYDAQKIDQVTSAYLNGDNILPDGTPVPAASGTITHQLDIMGRRAASAANITGNIKAKQAEAEVYALNKRAHEAIDPYGDTYLNKSPNQIMDTFKSDNDSQEKLGKFIAGQALNYEIAQGRIRLANGEPGALATENLMKLSGQQIDGKFPRLSAKARKAASDYLDKALSEGLKARLSVGIGASKANITGNNKGGIPTTNNDPLGIR